MALKPAPLPSPPRCQIVEASGNRIESLVFNFAVELSRTARFGTLDVGENIPRQCPELSFKTQGHPQGHPQGLKAEKSEKIFGFA